MTKYIELELGTQLTKKQKEASKYRGFEGSLGLEKSTQRQILFRSSNLERIIGKDDRKRVLSTEEYPFRMICKLSMNFHGQPTYAGSGALIGENIILTAAHNVYDSAMGAAHTITVAPGQADYDVLPFGEYTVSKVFFPEAYKTNHATDNDYACLVIDEPIGRKVGYFDIMSPSDNLLRNSILRLTGYPGDKGGTQMWHHFSPPDKISDTTITYKADTYGGNSGGPIYTYEDGQDDGRPTIMGIHTYGADKFEFEGQVFPEHNGGRRIDQEVLDAISEWKAAAAK